MHKIIGNNKYKNHSVVSYENYDYSDFWKGRDYEDQSDKIAISRLFSLIKGFRHKLIDIGGGKGRLTPLYENIWDEFVLLDSSKQQVDIAQKNTVHKKKATFVVSTFDKIPFPDCSFDAALCIRAFHYVDDASAMIEEINRILKPGGYLVLEIPNKLHLKNRISATLGINRSAIFSADPINISTKSDAIFLNHHPKTILKLLELNNFQVIKTLSVSNFRSNFMKKNLSVSFLTKLEKFAQTVFSPLWVGPSTYFLAKKLTNNHK